MVQLLWKTVWQFLTELNILLPYDPANVHFGIYPKELKTYIHTKIFTQIFITSLFIIVKPWKPPKQSSVDEWINKLWYNKVMHYYSLIKRNKLSGASLVAQWLGVCLLMWGTRVRALVWEDPTCHGAAGPVSQNC